MRETDATIDLSRPLRRERRRGFQPPWYIIYVYVCPKCHKETRVRASSFYGRCATPGVGGIYCPHCSIITEE